jgi:hypothetical protein
VQDWAHMRRTGHMCAVATCVHDEALECCSHQHAGLGTCVQDTHLHAHVTTSAPDSGHSPGLYPAA